MKQVINAKNIQKIFHTPQPVAVLKDISLEIFEGDSVAIMGPSGAGKSTLLHILGTLEKPTQGSLFLFGQDVQDISPYSFRNQHMGFIFQSFHLLEDYTVLENVLFPARIKNFRISQKDQERALLLLEEVHLLDRKNFPVKLLSGGEKQRVCLARALCNDPELILADEPSGNLDQKHAAIIHDLLISLTKKYGKTLVLVTHNQNLASLCNRILYLQHGSIVHM